VEPCGKKKSVASDREGVESSLHARTEPTRENGKKLTTTVAPFPPALELAAFVVETAAGALFVVDEATVV